MKPKLVIDMKVEFVPLPKMQVWAWNESILTIAKIIEETINGDTYEHERSNINYGFDHPG